MNNWLKISEHPPPKDGTRFLAWFVDTVDEYDDNDNVIRRGVKAPGPVVAYYLFDTIVEYPWTGAIIKNRQYTHWQPIQAP